MFSKTRITALKRRFTDFYEKYSFDMVSSSSKADRKYAKEFKYFKHKYADKLLDVYLRRCKDKHWFSFIQFRGILDDCDKDGLIDIFRERKEYLASL